MLSPENQSLIASIRQKVLAGTANIDDMRSAVKILREGRLQAQIASLAKSKTKPSGSRTPINTEALFAELDSKA